MEEILKKYRILEEENDLHGINLVLYLLASLEKRIETLENKMKEL